MSWFSKLVGLDKKPKTLETINQTLNRIWFLGGQAYIFGVVRKACAKAGVTDKTTEAILAEITYQVEHS